ncbi:hypothetical protein HYC85_020403 [Camellia sinensis]|uniref:Carbohydrate kinase PfkB domain-containing protein n=1 Tax=Camellia sinensis TaxID=4442 RepID=A0A7J7GS51_CAMSI|nr:hypothetical protein HYC85_020403 [Camellia sinensis]
MEVELNLLITELMAKTTLLQENLAKEESEKLRFRIVESRRVEIRSTRQLARKLKSNPTPPNNRLSKGPSEDRSIIKCAEYEVGNGSNPEAQRRKDMNRRNISQKEYTFLEFAVRFAKFIARKQWVVAGADDMYIRVYNYNTMDKVKVFEAHTDYIRCVAVHPTLPYVLSSSDDMLIKLWDWEKGWVCTQIFEGHSHYVMQVTFNPKDTNTFVSASLDRTIKPYLITGSDDHNAKVWDYQTKSCVQTLGRHTHNVSAVRFHPELPIIITGSEDGTRHFASLENTLNYGLERVWAIGYMKGSRRVVIGYDEGTIMVKIGREEPVASYWWRKITFDISGVAVCFLWNADVFVNNIINGSTAAISFTFATFCKRLLDFDSIPSVLHCRYNHRIRFEFYLQRRCCFIDWCPILPFVKRQHLYPNTGKELSDNPNNKCHLQISNIYMHMLKIISIIFQQSSLYGSGTSCQFLYLIGHKCGFLAMVPMKRLNIPLSVETACKSLLKVSIMRSSGVKFHTSTIRWAVVTLGPNGCIAKHEKEIVRVPAIGEAKAINATGAEDLFTSGFLYGLVKGLNLEECCKVGLCNGGSVIRALGGEVTPDNWQWMHKRMQTKGLTVPSINNVSRKQSAAKLKLLATGGRMMNAAGKDERRYVAAGEDEL